MKRSKDSPKVVIVDDDEDESSSSSSESSEEEETSKDTKTEDKTREEEKEEKQKGGKKSTKKRRRSSKKKRSSKSKTTPKSKKKSDTESKSKQTKAKKPSPRDLMFVTFGNGYEGGAKHKDHEGWSELLSFCQNATSQNEQLTMKIKMDPGALRLGEFVGSGREFEPTIHVSHRSDPNKFFQFNYRNAALEKYNCTTNRSHGVVVDVTFNLRSDDHYNRMTQPQTPSDLPAQYERPRYNFTA